MQDVDFPQCRGNRIGRPRHESRETCPSGRCVTARATGVLEGQPVERFKLWSVECPATDAIAELPGPWDCGGAHAPKPWSATR